MTRQTGEPSRRLPVSGPLDIYRYEFETGNQISPDTRQTLRPLSPWTQADFRRAKIGMVYILVDPRDHQVRYVGYTGGSLAARLREHLQSARRRRGEVNYHAINWLNDLLDKGLKPEIYAVDTFVAANWAEREQHWINVYRQLGCALTNAKSGGGGGGERKPSPNKRPKLSDEQKARISEAARRRFADPEERRRTSEARRGKGTGPYAPGRWRPPRKTHCPQGHEYTDENTIVHNGKRNCRTCVRAQDRVRGRRPNRVELAKLEKRRTGGMYPVPAKGWYRRKADSISVEVTGCTGSAWNDTVSVQSPKMLSRVRLENFWHRYEVLLLNGAGSPQTDADMARARRIAEGA